MPYDHISLIYNPNSTNNAQQKAEDFLKILSEHGRVAELVPTNHAGHAHEIAYDLAAGYARPLIISVSGDGGYNEIINGIMSAKTDEKADDPVVAVIAAGNANDHKRSTRSATPLIDLILDASPRPLDLLHLHAGTLNRYAHSYIGFGITPAVGVELNKHSLNPLMELVIIWKSFRDFTPFRIVRNGKSRSFSSLVCSNISGMAKIIKLSDDSDTSVRDGKFEVLAIHNHGKLHLLFSLARSVLLPHPRSHTIDRYEFTTTENIAVQLDGEIEKIPADTHTEITCESQVISSLY